MDVNSLEPCITAGQRCKIYITFIAVMRRKRSWLQAPVAGGQVSGCFGIPGHTVWGAHC